MSIWLATWHEKANLIIRRHKKDSIKNSLLGFIRAFRKSRATSIFCLSVFRFLYSYLQTFINKKVLPLFKKVAFLREVFNEYHYLIFFFGFPTIFSIFCW